MSNCKHCNKVLKNKRADAKFCNDSCRRMNYYRTEKLHSGVYFIKETGTDYYKIGNTTNIYNRIADIQTSNPRELVLIHFIKSNEHFIIERFHHVKFHHLHIRGEWFLDDGSITSYLTELKMSI